MNATSTVHFLPMPQSSPGSLQVSDWTKIISPRGLIQAKLDFLVVTLATALMQQGRRIRKLQVIHRRLPGELAAFAADIFADIPDTTYDQFAKVVEDVASGPATVLLFKNGLSLDWELQVSRPE